MPPKGSMEEVEKKTRVARALSNCLPFERFRGWFKKSELESEIIAETTPFAEDVVNLVAEIRKIPVGANVEELFLFELLLNASIALYVVWGDSLIDKERYKDKDSLEIHIITDEENQTLSIVDNGEGMTRRNLMRLFRSYEEPSRHFDTIKKYLAYQADADLSHVYKSKRSVMGLGFFSAYMVADKVVVTSRVQGDDPFVWECEANDNGVSTFSVAAAPVDDSFVRGTKVTLHLKPGHDQYLRVDKLQELVNKCEQLIHFQPILVFPNGKNEDGILLNDKKEEPIEKLQQKYEHIRLLFVKYISERTKKVEVVISDRPKEGCFCNLDVSEDLSKPPVLEINPRCDEMEVLRKMVASVVKFKEDRGEMVESSEGEKFQEECGVTVEKCKEAVGFHTSEICESDKQEGREMMHVRKQNEEHEDVVLVSGDKMELLRKMVAYVGKFKEDGGEMVESSDGEKFQEECRVIVEKFEEFFSEYKAQQCRQMHVRNQNKEPEDIVSVSGDKNHPRKIEFVVREIWGSDEQVRRETRYVTKQNEEHEDIVLVSGDKNDPNFKEAVSLPQKTKKQKRSDRKMKKKKEDAVKNLINEHFDWSLSRIWIYDGMAGTSFYDRAVEAIGLDYLRRWKRPKYTEI